MEEKFLNYIESIGITNALIPRVEHVIETLENISGEKILDIFISEYMQENGTRTYEDFRAFSKNYHLGALKFINDIKYIIWNRNNKLFSIINWEVSNYDFKSASPDSRLSLLGSFYFPGPILLKASQNNCDKLLSFFKKYLIGSLG